MIKIAKKNDVWNDIFEKYKILEKVGNDGKFEITSAQINEFREARLMTKFDNASQLPDIFYKNKLSLLPITKGSYVIAPMDIFSKFPELNHEANVQYMTFPEHLQSITPDSLTGESTALNCAYISGILSDFVEDEDIMPTVNGRMKSNNFEFNINNLITGKKMPIIVNNSQIEIDGGYEGAKFLSIIEAKNNMAEDFVIRQLYYPMRKWASNITKDIKTVFMIYTNNIFYLYNYGFEDVKDYNSLKLNKFQKYSFDKINIDISDIESLLKSTPTITEPQVPFPQADSFERVINLCELLLDNELTKDDVTVNYGFDKRQTDYYFNAGRYLGLMDINSNKQLLLTTEGKRIISLPTRARQLAFAKAIIKHISFKKILAQNLKLGKLPQRDEVIKTMKEDKLFNVNTDETYNRRASTVMSWVDWITSLING